MSKFRRQLMMASMGEPVPPTPVLPYDAEVEWLETDGAAFIDTGVKIANTTQFKITIRAITVPTTEMVVFGGRVALGNGSLMPYWKKTYWEWRYGTKSVNSSNFTLIADTDYVFSNTNLSRTLTINNGYTMTATAQTFSNNNNFYLLGSNYNGTLVNSPSGMAIVSAILYSSTEKVREYIAVRKNGVGYLYDKVSGALFGNANSTGAFIYGNDVTT